VDLNGAFAGHSAKTDAIKSIRAAIDLPIQLGGGIRDMAAVEAWLGAGITRVILGTAALTDPGFVKDAARKFPGQIVVGADAKGGKIATQGWAEVSELTPIELGKRFEDAGVGAVLFTDIDGDGLLKGVNVGATAALARSLSIPVIASGGVGSIADIDALLAANEPGIQGVVVGRALYDGRIDVAEALRRTA
jgi:phosphoribosylformimino-5-aminoimidazole carboxamide ribotide isomerase